MRNVFAYCVIALSAIASLSLLAPLAATTSPQESATDIETAPQPKRARLLFAGDIMCHYPQVTAAARGNGEYDFTPFFEYVKPIIESADVAIANFETTVSPDGRYSGYPAFSSPAQLAVAVKDAGFDIALTANNHCCDRSARGIRSTIECMDSIGIAHTGTFRDSIEYAALNPLRFESNGIKFALLNYTYGTNGIPVPKGYIVNLIDTLAIARDLETAKDADCRIAVMHWGDEYRRRPNREQQSLADFLHRHGADIIIGSHPHVIEPADTCGGKFIVYSLGNYVSNMSGRYCDGGIMAQVDIEILSGEIATRKLTLIPVWVKRSEYKILPFEVADTVEMSVGERKRYELFRADTESLLFSE